MQIKRIDNTKFNGIYRIKNTPKNLMEIEKYVEPMYTHLKHEPVFQFVGKHPFRVGLDLIMKFIADMKNGSVSWLKMNAENHGANFSGINDEELHIVSGKKEIESLMEFLLNRAEKKTGFLSRVKMMFSHQENYEDKPEHLRLLFKALEVEEEECNAFSEAYKDKIIPVKSTQELLQKMLCERD